MHTFKDIEQIIEKYYLKGSDVFNANFTSEGAQQARQIWTEGLTKLKQLKLMQDDSYNLKTLRKAFSLAIKSAQAIQEGKFNRFQTLLKNSSNNFHTYLASVTNKRVRAK